MEFRLSDSETFDNEGLCADTSSNSLTSTKSMTLRMSESEEEKEDSENSDDSDYKMSSENDDTESEGEGSILLKEPEVHSTPKAHRRSSSKKPQTSFAPSKPAAKPAAKPTAKPIAKPAAKPAVVPTKKPEKSAEKTAEKTAEIRSLPQGEGPSAKRPKIHTSGHWVQNFELPSRFSPDVEAALANGELSNLQKDALVRELVVHLSATKSSLLLFEREAIAEKIICKFPFLKSGTAPYTQLWERKLFHRMRNVARPKRNGSLQVVREKKGRPKIVSPSQVMPAIPEGADEASLGDMVKLLGQEWAKKPKDYNKISVLMDKTFPLRRRTILKKAVVRDVISQYPTLTDTRQVRAEIQRIMGTEFASRVAIQTFTQTWQPVLIQAAKKSTHSVVKTIMEDLDLQCEGDSEDTSELLCRAAFAVLPYLMGEKKPKKGEVGQDFWVTTDNSSGDLIDTLIKESKAPRLVTSGGYLVNAETHIAVEGERLCTFSNFNVASAVFLLSSFYFIFDMQYPKGLHGYSRNLYLFLDVIFFHNFTANLRPKLPVSVTNILGLLKKDN